jgi:small conductance mechanosensitive channel
VPVSDLDEMLEPGSTSFWQLLIAVSVIVASIFIARYVRRRIRRHLAALDGLDEGTGSIIGRLVGWVVVLVGLILALSILGVDMVPIALVLLLIGGFLLLSARTLIENWGAGLVLQARSPYRVGDRIETHGYVGYVEETNLRSVVIRQGDGRIVHIPNADVLKDPLVNRTGHEGRRRSIVKFNVAYDTSFPPTMALLKTAAASVDGVFAEPAPQAWIRSLDASSVMIELRFWHDHSERHRVRTDVANEALKQLTSAGVAMPFPTQEVLLSGSLDLTPDPHEEHRTVE